MANVFYFGDSKRRLFGIYNAPSTAKRRGVVLCNPLGVEYFYAHQSLRYLAQLLADAGIHVLRFDWYGTGDSAGTCDQGTKPESRRDDLEWAIDELKDMAGVRKVGLIGLRAGAVAASEAARQRRDVNQLVLWDTTEAIEPQGLPKTLRICHAGDQANHLPAAAQTYDGPQAWSGDGDFGAAGMPVQALQSITKWLAP